MIYALSENYNKASEKVKDKLIMRELKKKLILFKK
jgi:hypothetical protein